MAQNTEVTIVNGPSRWDLLLALFDRDGEMRVRRIFFKLREVEGVHCSIYSAKLIGENVWELKGVMYIFLNEGCYVPFKAEYDDHTRNGTLTIFGGEALNHGEKCESTDKGLQRLIAVLKNLPC